MIVRIKSEDPWAFLSAVISEQDFHDYQVKPSGRTVMQTVLFLYLLWAGTLRQSSPETHNHGALSVPGRRPFLHSIPFILC